MKTEKEIEKLAEEKYPIEMRDEGRTITGGHYDIDINYLERRAFIAGYKAALQNKSDISSTISPIADFAFRLAKVIKESRSSTALFFVQQAYPDDVDGLDQRSTDDILDTVILQSQILLKECAAIVNKRKDSAGSEKSRIEGVLLGLKICKEMWAQGTLSHENIYEHEILYKEELENLESQPKQKED